MNFAFTDQQFWKEDKPKWKKVHLYGIPIDLV